MAANHIVSVDLAKVQRKVNGKNKLVRILAWGDRVEVVKTSKDEVTILVTDFVEQEDGSILPEKVEGTIRIPKALKTPVVIPKSQSKVLKVDFVDVQQGDGAVIETPKGKVILVDGGDNDLFARYLASRFRGTSKQQPKEIECILVSHGDADHFLGLTKIHESEGDPRLAAFKRLFIHPQRVYHNGLVKRPSKTANGKARSDLELLGKTKKVKDPDTGKEITLITGLETDLLKVPDSEMNMPFLAWKRALTDYKKRGPIHFRKLSVGDHDAFDFLSDEEIGAEVLAPIPVQVAAVEGLRFLGDPPKGPRVGHESLSIEQKGFKGFSASHTINGHSIIFRLNYGGFRFLFSGDLNDEAGRILTTAHNRGIINLQSEVFKVPHHGSADFSGAFLQAVAPVISVISSGDESSRKEYIHPRATIVGALGRYSRVEEPLIFVTELAAFFQIEGFVDPEFHAMKPGLTKKEISANKLVNFDTTRRFFALSRKAFGIVMVRTDGQRLLVYTNSALTAMKEAYAYKIDEYGKPTPDSVLQA